MEAWDRGFSNVPEKSLCNLHIEETAIRLYINRSGIRGICDYCGLRRAIRPLEEVVAYVADGIGRFYTDPANFMSYESAEGGYLGNVYTMDEILQEQLELEIADNDLFDDFHGSFDQNKPWSNEFEYYDHDAEIRLEHWAFFKEVVITKSRYLFSSTDAFRTELYGLDAYSILHQVAHISKKLNLIHTIPIGTTLYRCRQHRRNQPVGTASQLTSPPNEHAVHPNRMSPAGVSMFYGAFEIGTSLSETISVGNKKQRFYTVGKFQNADELLILDLSKCPVIPSIFEQRLWDRYYEIAFLNAFIHDFTKSIEKDGKEHIDYVPTQIVTEYFRYAYPRKGARRIDGVIYPSSKRRGSTACVLFMDHDQSLEKLEFVEVAIDRGKVLDLNL